MKTTELARDTALWWYNFDLLVAAAGGLTDQEFRAAQASYRKGLSPAGAFFAIMSDRARDDHSGS